MKKLFLILVIVSLTVICAKAKDKRNSFYITNQAPLIEQPYTALPIGAIKPKGMLLEMLERQKEGLTGHLDSIYAVVCGDNNGWLGGTGDGWERGPYWLDGLVPLAYLLDDEILKAKAQKWIEWSIANQRPDGYFGPRPLQEGYEYIPGTQQGMREDWWPKMVMLKVLQQYYSATKDERVIGLMDKYFRYQLKTLSEKPLDFLTFWANRRGGDNLMMVFWLYNITGEKYLLELADVIHEQTFPWGDVFLNDNVTKPKDTPWYAFGVNSYPFDEDEKEDLSLTQIGGFHCVNVAQGIKAPIVYYQKSKDKTSIDAVKKAFYDVETYHGQAQGMYGGDEPLHGNDPVQGIELCSIVEMMYSLETMLQVTGDIGFADHLEKLAFNALPTQSTDEYSMKQYFQTANQIEVSRNPKNFYQDVEHDCTGSCYGTLTGYPCCLCNMHQGWPKFVQNLWYASANNGLAALVYSSSEVTAKVGNGSTVTFVEETNYPFTNNVSFTYSGSDNVSFPFHLRIPAWCEQAIIKVNGVDSSKENGNQIVVVNRQWKKGDVLELILPMKTTKSRWCDFSVAIERGPLVYALKVEETWKYVSNDDKYRNFYEVYPASKWNYSLIENDLEDLDDNFQFASVEGNMQYPWNIENAPVMIKARGVVTDGWQKIKGQALDLPWSPKDLKTNDYDIDEIILIPYGCTTLRITEFPTVKILK
ncbi:beta-L-arabinofuranosidase domain-containing protein [Sunxiuqinia sp. A32]|uniref:beta-L-arabinofuranosidase domain-containing protein n=1 Tax=Sunxiuqinia sp. A32 TaxID=3461496 RepID=UPI0040460813